MGWLFIHNTTKRDIIDRCLHGGAAPSHYHPLAHCVRGNHLWVVAERRPEAPTFSLRPDGTRLDWPERMILLYLLDRGDNGWGYKDLSEESGPAAVDCPLRYLDMVPDPATGYASAWRAQVRAHHAERAQKRERAAKIQPGMVLDIQGGRTGIVSRVVKRSGPQRAGVYAYIDGGEFRVPARLIEGARAGAPA